jgi:hypothetical protein
MVNPFFSPGSRHDAFLNGITGLFWAILGVAVVLALTILLLPNQLYLAISNYLQIITAIAGALIFLASWSRYGRKESLLWATGAFALWGISNIAWYVNVLTGQRNAVFPSLIDIGIIVSIFLLAVAFWKGDPRRQIGLPALSAVLVIVLILPVGVIATQGAGVPALVTLLYFFACGSLIIAALNHSPQLHPHIFTGTLLFVLAFMAYPLREMFFITNPVLNVIGVMVFAGFSLIVIGMLAGPAPGKTP